MFKADWIAYILALTVVLVTIYSGRERDVDAPPPPPDAMEDGPLLGPQSAFDEQVLIQVADPTDGLGTAFAVNRRGDWLTARHVVEGCDSVGLLVGGGAYLPASGVAIDPDFDLAVISTGRSPNPVRLDLESPLRIGQAGYHVGYPQGRPGEATARLLARSNLVTRGARKGREPVLAWAEVGRTRGLDGSLGGMSGGPVYDAQGRVRGVVVAESPRRGRIYTTAPSSVSTFLAGNGIEPEAGDARALTTDNYGGEADRARRTLQVVKVACTVGSR